VKDENKGLDKLVWMVGNFDSDDELLHYEDLQKILETVKFNLKIFFLLNKIQIILIF
jgi:hypothetical protein